MGNRSRFWLSCLALLLPKTVKLLGFPIYRLWWYLMKVFPETRHVSTTLISIFFFY